MTKEKIIEIVNDCVQYNANQGTWSIDNRFADELLALIEQEKDDLLKEFVEWYKAHLNYLVKYEKDLRDDAINNQHEDNAVFFFRRNKYA